MYIIVNKIINTLIYKIKIKIKIFLELSAIKYNVIIHCIVSTYSYCKNFFCIISRYFS